MGEVQDVPGPKFLIHVEKGRLRFATNMQPPYMVYVLTHALHWAVAQDKKKPGRVGRNFDEALKEALDG